MLIFLNMQKLKGHLYDLNSILVFYEISAKGGTLYNYFTYRHLICMTNSIFVFDIYLAIVHARVQLSSDVTIYTCISWNIHKYFCNKKIVWTTVWKKHNIIQFFKNHIYDKNGAPYNWQPHQHRNVDCLASIAIQS